MHSIACQLIKKKVHLAFLILQLHTQRNIIDLFLHREGVNLPNPTIEEVITSMPLPRSLVVPTPDVLWYYFVVEPCWLFCPCVLISASGQGIQSWGDISLLFLSFRSLSRISFGKCASIIYADVPTCSATSRYFFFSLRILSMWFATEAQFFLLAAIVPIIVVSTEQ